jgi:hypothetical protein
MKKYYQLLKDIQVEPPYGLSRRIMLHVDEANRSALRVRFFTFVIVALGSSVVFVDMAINLFSNLGQTGFYQYSSLLLSDGATIGLYWKQLGLSLIESLPLLNIAMLLVVLGVFIWSGTKAISNTRDILPA